MTIVDAPELTSLERLVIRLLRLIPKGMRGKQRLARVFLRGNRHKQKCKDCDTVWQFSCTKSTRAFGFLTTD